MEGLIEHKVMMEGRCVSIVNDSTLPVDSPIVYCNSVSDRWEDILTHCNGLGCPKFRLVLISNMDWDVDLSPWAVEPVVSKKDRFNGGADKYLSWMLDKLLPYVNTFLTENGSGQPFTQILAGYSLAGLFALYSMYRTTAFSKIVSASGSVWFPGFESFALSHRLPAEIKGIYLSIGDKESISKISALKETENITRRLAEYYSGGSAVTAHQNNPPIRTIFELNQGNHFTDYDLRLAKGITAVLK
jgi:predicted alpha/beta superfamily hydrolase